MAYDHDNAPIPATRTLLFAIISEASCVCYLASGTRVIQVADVHPPTPDHSDIAGSGAADSQYQARFTQYVGAVITALARTRSVRNIYMCGHHQQVRAVLQHLPSQIADRAAFVHGEGSASTAPRMVQRVHRLVLSGTVPQMHSPFGFSDA